MLDESVTVESRDGKHVGQRILRLTGKLTFPTPADDERFLKQILVEPASTVILDLSGVISCDSSGVGELMRIHIAFKREKRRLALAATREKVADDTQGCKGLRVLQRVRDGGRGGSSDDVTVDLEQSRAGDG